MRYLIFTELVIVFLIIHVWYLKKQEYVCSQCGTKFSPPLIKKLFTIHFFNKRYLTCPFCGHKGMFLGKWRSRR